MSTQTNIRDRDRKIRDQDERKYAREHGHEEEPSLMDIIDSESCALSWTL